MNQNYFTPPNARNSSNPFNPSPQNSLSPPKYPEPHPFTENLRFLSNPKSEYEDRQALLKKAHNEELRRSYKSHLEQLSAAKSRKQGKFFRQPPSPVEKTRIPIRASEGRLSPELLKAGKVLTEAVFFSPQLPRKEMNQFKEFRESQIKSSPWIEDFSRREEELARKRDFWIQSLNQQVNEKKLKNEKKVAQQKLKEKQDEERIRKELQEIDLLYKKELSAENGEDYDDQSLRMVSMITPQREMKVLKEQEKIEFREPLKKSIVSKGFKEKKDVGFNKVNQIDQQQKLVELRSNMNELIKDLRFEAQASKYEKDEVLQEFNLFRNFIHEKKNVEELASPGLMRAGKSMLDRYRVSSIPYRGYMNIY
jgi:hypothetical protein